ncbi:MAG: uncharacterized protein KVP18_001962 [Porospora cf. gigantea A]|nr:MAG: hypothetical protein KVP18_001962 [Porospora cf. gigantea A]
MRDELTVESPPQVDRLLRQVESFQAFSKSPSRTECRRKPLLPPSPKGVGSSGPTPSSTRETDDPDSPDADEARKEFYFPCWLLLHKKDRRLSIGDVEGSKQKRMTFVETLRGLHSRCKSSSEICRTNEERFVFQSVSTPRSSTLSRAHSFRGLGILPGHRSHFNARIPPYVTLQLSDFQSSVARFRVFQHLRDLQKGTHECIDAKCPMLIKRSAVRPPATSGLYLDAGSFSIPNPEKLNGGEDAYFISDCGHVLGVSDGVGEWSDFGINPRRFSQTLMNACKSHVDTNPSDFSTGSRKAFTCLDAGWQRTHNAMIPGAATCIVAAVNEPGTSLGIANLGDSACFVLRRDQRLFTNMTVLKRTREQQHFFNCPFQLSYIPDPSQFEELEKQGLSAFVNLLRTMNESCYGYRSDIPEMADTYEVSIKEGDLVIVATDGLFDNLFDMEVSSLVSDCLSPYEVDILKECDELTKAWFNGQFIHPLAVEPPSNTTSTPPEAIAKALVQAAFARSMDTQASTPFGRNARKEGHRNLSVGGKLDDITVVAAWVKRR